MSSTYIIQEILAGLTMGSIYSLVAISYNFINSTTNIINFAQGEFVMLGAMVCLAFMSIGVSFSLAIILTLVIVGGISYLLELIAYETVVGKEKKVLSISWIVSTMAFGIILANGAMLLWGKQSLPFPSLFSDKVYSFGAIVYSTQEFGTLICALLLAVFSEILMHHTVIGKAIKATSNKREIAEYMGINTKNIIILCFVLSGFISAFAGILIAPFLFASTVMGMIVGLKGFAVAILGGLCSGKGAIIAGLLLGVIEKLGGAVLGDGYRNIVCFGVLIVVLVFRPQGMFGIKISVKA